MANLHGFSCGECYHVYEARLWEPQCPRCQSADTMQISDAEPAPTTAAPLAAPTCVYCGQPVAVGFSALCEQHLAMCIPCVESHARDEDPHVGCVQVDCYCFDCHATDP